MTKNLIISAHTDDAIFSMGDMILEMIENDDQVTILSPFAGIPEDEVGKKKHTKLREEHELACEILGVELINGDFLDDVYPENHTTQQLVHWFDKFLTTDYDAFYIPLGIHHPDHVEVRETLLINFPTINFFFYEELPYAVLYPEIKENLRKELTKKHIGVIVHHNPEKEAAVNAYQSQVAPHLLPQLFVDETIWALKE